MSNEQRTERAQAIAAVVQIGLLVALAVLQDPEVRRNVVWAVQWTSDRLRAIVSPDDDEPPPAAVTAVIQEAREITKGNA